jgi:glycerol kinase
MSAIVDKISNLVVGDKTAKMDPKDEVFVGSIDQGTTSSRFLIFDKAGEPVAVHQEEFKQIYPNPG